MNQIPQEKKCHGCPLWRVYDGDSYWCNLYDQLIGYSLMDRLEICLKNRPRIVEKEK